MPPDTQPAPRKRTIHQLDTPFSAISWPEISSEDQEAILELLCSLLSPIGKHKRDHVKVSRGKKAAAKAKRMQEPDVAPELVPPAPELIRSVDVGLSSITRALQVMSQSNQADKSTETGEAKNDSQSPYAMVFVARGDQPSTFNCHFPKIIGAASASLPPKDRIRLVGFSKPSSERLSNCLHVARVSSVAVKRDAPGAGPLWDFVKERVKPVEVSWLEGQQNASYIPTKINSMETTIGPKKVRPSLDQK